MKIFGVLNGKSKRLMALEVIVLVLLASTIGVVSGQSGQVFTKNDCPACPELGMKFYRAYYTTTGPEGLKCIYGSPSGHGSCSGATLSIGVYTDAKAGEEGFEFWRNNFGDEKALKLPHKMIKQDYSEYDKYFACVKQFSLDYWADGVFLYQTKYVIWIRIEQNDENDAIKAFKALEKCAKEVVDKKEGVSEGKCEDFCRRMVGEEHLVWDKKSQWPDCKCMCEIGYGEYEGKCVECEKVCQAQSRNDPHYHYDSKTSKPNECACKCDNPYFWDDTKEKCIKCPPNSKPTGTSPCVERVRRECCCDNGYVASLDGLECLHFTNDAKMDHTLKNAPHRGKQHFVEMPNGKQIKVTVKPQKRGWQDVFPSAAHPPAQAKKTFRKLVLNPRQLDEPDSKYNCGGHVFGGSQMWIAARQFPVILTEDNNYKMVERTKIKEGDVASYYAEGGNPMHVGKIIRASDGSLKVESKFSYYPLCEHEIDNVVNAMGIRFFRGFK